MVEKTNTPPVRFQTQGNISSEIELNLPKPIYNKMQIGVISNRSRLDDILDTIHIPYEEYILYVEAVKVRLFNLPNLTLSLTHRYPLPSLTSRKKSSLF